MENYAVFDTETTSLDKPFCYNIGYLIFNEQGVLVKRDFVVDQIWSNLPLFQSAYYADKREIYISRMRARSVIREKFGYICSQMRRDFARFEVKRAFAYNSSFDDRVFQYNCDWFKCINPFDDIKIVDIRGFVHQFLISNEFKGFCEKYERFTENGNYSTTAETVYQFINDKADFEEEHTALSDSIIEYEILRHCLSLGANINNEYEVKFSIPRNVIKTLTLISADNEEYEFKYEKIRINKERTKIVMK